MRALTRLLACSFSVVAMLMGATLAAKPTLQTYHIAAAGNDANSGLSELLPFHTYTHAMAVVPANAIVLGKGGDLFRETATVAQDGVTFAAYGLGRPTLSGADPMSGWAAAGVGTNTFSVAVGSAVRQVHVGATAATLGASASTLTNGQWFYAASVLYYRSDAGNPDTVPLVIEAGQRDYNINQNSHAGVAVYDHICQRSQHSSNAAIYFQGTGKTNGATVSRCLIQDTYRSGIIVHATSDGTVFTSNTFLNNGQHCIWYDFGSVGDTNVTITFNTMTGNGWIVDGSINFPSGIIGCIRSGVVAFNTITNQGFGGSGGHAHAIYCGNDLAPGLTLLIHDNTCTGSYNGTAIKCTQDATVSFNVGSFCTGGGLNAGQNSGTFNCTVIAHHNLFHDNCSIGGAGIDVKNAGSSGTLSFKGYHNTLGNNSPATSGGELLVETLLTVFDWRNNIHYATNTASAKYIQSFVAQTGTVTCDYNCFANSPNTTPFRYNGTGMSLATWKALGFAPDAHSITSDPLFTNAALGDYSLRSISPCIDAGIAIAGINDGYLGLAPDMGYQEKA